MAAVSRGGTQGRPRVVALGDSITLGVGDAPLVGLGAGWAAHVAHALGATTYVNLAANGVRARALGASQVPTALMHRPDVVLLTVGGNDVLRGDFSPEEIAEKVSDALTRLRRPGREIVMISLDRIALFSLLGRRVAAVMAHRIDATNDALAKAAAGGTAHWVDGAHVFARLGAAAWHIDRIHPSPLGHRALATEALHLIRDSFAQVHPMIAPEPMPSSAQKAWWLARRGLPWAAKRSRDLIPQVAQVVTHEMLKEHRARTRALAR